MYLSGRCDKQASKFLPRLLGKLKGVRAASPLIARAWAVLLGLVFLTAGTGKALGQAEFRSALEGLFLTPGMARLVAAYLPWVEIGVGLLLVLGIVPRSASALSMSLACAFIASNSWALASSAPTPMKCGGCFGIWESLLGSLSPLQALLIDVVLLCLALVILTQTPSSHPFFRCWTRARTAKHPDDLRAGC